MAFDKPIQSGLSALAGGVFTLSMSIPAPSIDNLFKTTGSTFHIVAADAPLYADADTASKVKGTLMARSCVQWVEKAAGGFARVTFQTSTKLKEVWVHSSLLDPAPPERSRDSCKATFIPGADRLDARAK